MTHQYMRDEYGRTCRVVVVQRPTQPQHLPMPYTQPVRIRRVQRKRGCLFPTLVLIGVIGSIVLILMLMADAHPETPLGNAGQMAGGWLSKQQDILAGGGIGVRTITSNGEPIEPIIVSVPLETFTADTDIRRSPSISAEQIDSILVGYGSPAEGTGHDWYELGVQYGIDPAIPLAFFVMESTAGTHAQWAGWKGDGTTTHNVGNIICAGSPSCFGRFRDYPTWRDGIEDWYKLLVVEYITGRQLTTLTSIIPVYAPAFENDVSGYIATVVHLVQSWEKPVQTGHAEIWTGATVCAGTGWHDGAYDFCAPEGTPVHLPRDMYFDSIGRYDDEMHFGEYWIGIDSTGIEWYFGHLKNTQTYQTGTLVQAGTKIGELGPFPYTIPHTHIQLKRQGRLVDEFTWMSIWENKQ